MLLVLLVQVQFVHAHLALEVHRGNFCSHLRIVQMQWLDFGCLKNAYYCLRDFR